MTESEQVIPEKKVKGRRWRPYLLTLVVLAPLFLLLLLELGLRLGGYGYSTDIAVRQTVNEKDVYVYNRQLGHRFLPKSHVSEINPFVFDVEKDPRTYRVFILGGSAAHGFPDGFYNFGRILELMLESQYQGTDFEVINVAMATVGSRGIYHIAKSCARFSPDLMIVYLANNEIIADPGPRTLAPSQHGFFSRRAGLAIASTRTGQLLKGLTQKGPLSDSGSDYVASGMTIGEFKRNLSDICDAGTGSGARVVLASVPYNPGSDEQRQACDKVNEAIRSVGGETGEGISLAEVARACEAARAEQKLLYDHVHLRFAGNYLVAATLMNSIASVLPEYVIQYKSDNELMTEEDCRERLMYTDLERYQSLRTIIQVTRGDYQTLLSGLDAEVDAIKPGIRPLLQELLKKYRDLVDEYPDDWRLRWKVADYCDRYYANPLLASLQANKIIEVIPYHRAIRLLMQMATRDGRLDEAEKLALQLIDSRPSESHSYFDVAEIHQKRGDYEEAIKYYARGIKLRPGAQSVVAYTYMAQLYEAIGQPKKAIKALSKAVSYEPRNHAETAYVSLGLLLAAEGKDDEAVKVLRAAIEAFPANTLPRRDEVILFLRSVGETSLSASLRGEDDGGQTTDDSEESGDAPPESVIPQH